MKTYLTFILFFIYQQLSAQYYFKKFDINPGSASSSPADFVSYGSTLLFNATDASGGQVLYSLDGNSLNPVSDVMLKSVHQTAEVYDNIAVINGKKILIGTEAATGDELWISDGTIAGTTLLKDINPGAASSLSSGKKMAVINNKAYFAADDGVNGVELWVTDGTTAGTTMVKDIHPSASSNPEWMTAVNNKLYFSCTDNLNGNELWISDGTAAGTQLLKDINAGSSNSGIWMITASGNNIFFRANTATYGTELWVSDGTVSGTKMLKDISTGSASGIINTSSKLLLMNGKVYFSARDADGDYLWVTDGTTAGTQPVTKGKAKFAVDGQYITYNSKIYFNGYDDTHGYEPWVTDGTNAGTSMITEIYPGTTMQSSPAQFVIFNGLVYFTAYNNKRTLYRTDGTAAGTQGMTPSAALSNKTHLEQSMQLITHNNSIYFLAEYDNSGKELWAWTPFPESITQSAQTSSDITLYPNPAHHNFTIKTTTAFTKGSVTLTDVTGKVVMNKYPITNSQLQIPTTGIAPGIYIADVWVDDKRSTQKLVIE